MEQQQRLIRSHNPASRVGEGRNRELDVYQRAILATADGFKVFDPLTVPDALQDACFLTDSFRRHQDRDRFADHFLPPCNQKVDLLPDSNS